MEFTAAIVTDDKTLRIKKSLVGCRVLHVPILCQWVFMVYVVFQYSSLSSLFVISFFVVVAQHVPWLG